jgi:hypothetical protein
VPAVPARDRPCSGSCTRLVPARRCLFSKHADRKCRLVKSRPNRGRPIEAGAMGLDPRPPT